MSEMELSNYDKALEDYNYVLKFNEFHITTLFRRGNLYIKVNCYSKLDEIILKGFRRSQTSQRY
jgi:hypothetical protein